MRHHQHPFQESGGLGWHVFRLLTIFFRLRSLILLAGAAVISYGIYSHFKVRTTAPQSATDIRMPIANAPLEPDRPDLIGEPRIDE